jgi:hypothetical protein
MDGEDLRHRLDLGDHGLFYQNVDSIPAFEIDVLVDERQRDLVSTTSPRSRTS